MNLVICNIDEINSIDELVDNSANGTAFSYKYFLKMKNVNNILCVYSGEKLMAILPLFEKNGKLLQTTMYIPYGGPVFLFDYNNYRKNFLLRRDIVNNICKFLKKRYNELCFSFDPMTLDLIPCVNNGLIPEIRYTYKINLLKNFNEIYKNIGHDRKKDLKLAKKLNLKVFEDERLDFFDIKKSLIWEKKYGNYSSYEFVKKYLLESVNEHKGMNFVAKINNKVVGGVAIVWDKNNAYILYSYYEKGYRSSIITSIYIYIIKFLKDKTSCKYLDFEGSVFKEIEEWNLSFGATQYLYFNFYWSKNNVEEIYEGLYDYGEK